MSHVSLKDVAVRSGVTFPTVSKVLRGKDTVSPETRVAILLAAEAPGYMPAVFAPDLANKKTSTIGSALRASGRCVPEGCTAVGCDDLPLSAHVFPSLTTMPDPFHAPGEAAIRLLFDLIAQRVTTPQKVLLPVHLVARAAINSALTT